MSLTMLQVSYLCFAPVNERISCSNIHKLVFCQQPFQLPVGIACTDIALDIAEHAVLQRTGFLEVFLILRLALEGNLLVDEVVQVEIADVIIPPAHRPANQPIRQQAEIATTRIGHRLTENRCQTDRVFLQLGTFMPDDAGRILREAFVAPEIP